MKNKKKLAIISNERTFVKDNEFYCDNVDIKSIPEGLDNYSSIATESFPAAMRIGAQLLGEGNILGSELIDNARIAFMEGMVGSAMVCAVVAFITAILVKFYMPGKTK